MTPQMRIYSYFDQSHFRDMVLLFDDNSTDGYDWGLDATHPNDADFADAYFAFDPNGVGDEYTNYVIQTIPYAVEKKVHYKLTLDQPTEIIVQAVQEINLPYDIAFLWDSQENTYQQITGNQTASLNLPAGDYIERFYIVFKGGAQAGFIPDADRSMNVDNVLGNVDFFQNNREAQLEIMNPEGYELKYAHVFDMTGKLVTTKTDLGNGRNYNISTATMADGMYLVKLVTSDNVSIDYKAIVTNK